MMTQLDAAMAAQPEPADPVAAVTHPDPYPYYARLAAERPFHRDEKLKLWVAAGAEAVTAVLESDLCHVRPPAEPVPAAIAGTPIAEIFGRAIRFTDGETRCPYRHAVAAGLSAIAPSHLTEVASRRAEALIAAVKPTDDPRALTRFLYSFPVQVVASLLGIPAACLDETVTCVQDYAAAIAPIATSGDVERGGPAAGRLWAIVAALLDHHPTDGLLATLAAETEGAGREMIIANGIALMWQGYESMAGLIGNALVMLGRHPKAVAAIRTTPSLAANLVQEVLSLDPPTHSTRRFVARDGEIDGRTLRQGESILVLFAAATRDPATGTVEGFDLYRRQRHIMQFGAGAHACPGDTIARQVAEIGLRHLLDARLDPTLLAARPSYRPSLAIRAPLFA
jgi:cytochrome P450